MFRDVQISIPNIHSEILARIFLLSIVCIMHTTLQPHIQYLTEIELLHDYKRPRKESLISPWVMILLIIFVPLFTFMIPYLHARNAADTTQALLAWSLACAINAFLTETGKLIIGRLRPDFFYRCFPNDKIPKDLRCTGNLKDVIEGRKSFPSGHSSFSFCSLGFVSLWLCGKLGVLSRNRGQSVRVLTCLTPLVAAGVVAMSRFCDNHHHWEDILAGSIIGFTSSYFCYRQYYHPLDSELSGEPYMVIVTENVLSDSTSEEECCTKDLEVEWSIHYKKS